MSPSQQAASQWLQQNSCTPAAAAASAAAAGSSSVLRLLGTTSKRCKDIFIYVCLLGMLQQIWDADISVTPSSCYFSFILTSLVYLLQFYNLQLTNAWLSKQFTKQTSKGVSKTQFPNLHSVSVHTKCSLYGRDIQSFQGSWCRCDHRSFRRNTHLYLNS